MYINLITSYLLHVYSVDIIGLRRALYAQIVHVSTKAYRRIHMIAIIRMAKIRLSRFRQELWSLYLPRTMVCRFIQLARCFINADHGVSFHPAGPMLYQCRPWCAVSPSWPDALSMADHNPRCYPNTEPELANLAVVLILLNINSDFSGSLVNRSIRVLSSLFMRVLPQY